MIKPIPAYAKVNGATRSCRIVEFTQAPTTNSHWAVVVLDTGVIEVVKLSNLTVQMDRWGYDA